MGNITYENRLKQLNLHLLERRRVRGDFIKVFKSFRGINKEDIDKIPVVNIQDRTRSNGFKLE